MSWKEALVGVVARDSRYTIQAYGFVFESLEYAKTRKRRKRPAGRKRGRSESPESPMHVTGQELCQAARELAIRQYGMLGGLVLGHWGIRSTSDLGEIVYNLIASGDFEKTESDSRADFDDVFDFEAAFEHDDMVALDEPT